MKISAEMVLFLAIPLQIFLNFKIISFFILACSITNPIRVGDITDFPRLLDV